MARGAALTAARWWRSRRVQHRIGIVCVASLPLLLFTPLDALFWSLWWLPFAFIVVRSARGSDRLWRSLALGMLGGVAGFALGVAPAHLFAPRWLVERRLAPLIAAIDRFHRERGRWPRDEGEIAPKYLEVIPQCPNGTIYDLFGPWGAKAEAAIAGAPAQGQQAPPPILTCGLGMFLKYTWRFEPRGWTEWD